MANSKGFTLIEMIISITILGITMALAYAALRVATSTTMKVGAEQEKVEELRTTDSFLRHYLSQATDNGASGVSFLGQRDGLTFYSTVPLRSLGGGRKYRFRLFQEDNGAEETRLMLSYAPADEVTDDEPEKQVLATYAGQIRFSYLDAAAGVAENIWQDAWQQTGLPFLVKVRARNGSSLDWPEQVVPLRYAGWK